MTIRYVCGAATAAVLSVGMATFAQTPQSQPRPASEADAQSETPITLVGCLQREADYRRAQDAGRGGVAATGVGLGNEFVLVNATTSASDAAVSSPSASAGADCAATGSGEAYELTGDREPSLAQFVGRRIEITGMLKPADTATGTSGGAVGSPRPTGGFDPLGQDLRLREVNVTSYREPAASAPPAAGAAGQATSPQQPEPQPRPAGTSGAQDTLPRTASPLPMAGLVGLLSLAGALGLRSLRHRQRRTL